MSEIWNLSTICPCCHADGHFKSLSLAYQGKNGVEIYEIMLRDTLGVFISTPQNIQTSYAICDKCICQLQDAFNFKNQVSMCEQKFKVYCTNELIASQDSVKLEVEYLNNDDDFGNDNSSQEDDKIRLHVKKEFNIEVDIKHPIADEDVKKVELQQIENPTQKSHVTEKVVKNIKTAKSRQRIRKEIQPKKQEPCLIVEVNTENGVQYSCKECGGCYQAKKDISLHINKQHHAVYKCEYCHQRVKSRGSLKRHLKLHIGKIFECPHCPKRFRSQNSLNDHVNAHTGDIIYKCDICQKDFKYKQTLRKHLKYHDGTLKKILCDLCGKSFNDRTNLEIHVRCVHEKQRAFSCNFCNKTFTLKIHLKRHLWKHTGGENSFQCDICEYRLTDAKSMKMHRLKHDNKYMCKFCLQIFDDITERRNHMKLLHHESHPCSLCRKTFCSKSSLNRHMDEHKGIKRFSCDICGFKFSQKSILNRHIFRKHNPEADFDKNKTKCAICKGSFKNIAVHMDSHVNRKVFCELCGKTYPNNSALNRHKDIKHFGLTYDCDICSKKYKGKTKLKTHKLKVHKVKVENDSPEHSLSIPDQK